MTDFEFNFFYIKKHDFFVVFPKFTKNLLKNPDISSKIDFFFQFKILFMKDLRIFGCSTNKC